jgi:hypothetical protein
MPTQVTVTETYWTTCHKEVRYSCGVKWCYKKVWGVKVPYPCGVKWCTRNVPYPCRKHRQVTKWRYDFSVVHENCKVFYAKLYGCEGGKEYTWSSRCAGWFDIYHPGPITKYFKNPLSSLGSCREGYSIPPGGQIP